MRIGGFQKISLIDYPGKVAAVVFTQGCNFRCPFCHNLPLVIPSCFKDPIPEEDVLNFLATRIDKLQGVVVTGGEPTLHIDLPLFLQKIKALGYAVKLDTNGSRPEMIKQLMDRNLVDYIAMDVKAPVKRYCDVAGVTVNLDNIMRSIQIILSSSVSYQFRTTLPKPLLTEDDLPGILELIRGADKFVLQPFIPQDTLIDSSLMDKVHYSEKEFESIRLRWENRVSVFSQA